MKKLINSDPLTGKKTYFHGEIDGNYVSTEMDVTPILNTAKEEANSWRYGSLIGNTQKHKQKVADISAPLSWVVLRLTEFFHQRVIQRRRYIRDLLLMLLGVANQ